MNKTRVLAVTPLLMLASFLGVAGPLHAQMPMAPGIGQTPDYLGMTPNWAFTQPLSKFVDKLPGLGSGNANNLGQFIPVAVADTTTYAGDDYYEVAVVEYTEKMHSELPKATRLRGYVQIETPVIAAMNPAVSKHVALTYPDGTPILDARGAQVYAVEAPHYLGPLIVGQGPAADGQLGRPTRVKFYNYLPKGGAGDLFIPVDTSVMGAGMGPLGMAASPMNYTQNRATLHLHGGNTPWLSDGTPHQWTVPAGETTPYKKGLSSSDVPDMPATGDGEMTFYYTNQQSARLMFYHDHSYGITRLNVYAGEAAGYLIWDPVEEDMISGTNVTGVNPNGQKVLPDLGGIYHFGIPLIIQDKGFVSSTTLTTDPTWTSVVPAGAGQPGDLWLPHVYMPNQDPNNNTGANMMGRWDYGPWFWPPVTNVANGPITLPTGIQIPGIPNPTIVPEAFMDTPVINGTAYPYVEVPPTAVRFRVLNACNDRYVNLGLYVADPANPTDVKTVPATLGCSPAVFPPDWIAATDGAGVPSDILDGRAGGVPDPSLLGPPIIQIGTEGGFLPAPVVIPPTPIGFNYNRRNIIVLNVSKHSLYLGPAERGDVIVDFSAFAGKTLILYNDAPAALPAGDPRNDYYTNNPDLTGTGGAPPTLDPTKGPNTRTIMQIRVLNTTAGPDYVTTTLPGLQALLAAAFAKTQPPIIVPETAYGAPTDTYARIQSTSLNVNGTAMPLQPKAIQELFELNYGRMNATLGVELPFTNFNIQTTIPLGYVDPLTESLTDGQTQLWKVTHNGVDTHAIHFHLFNVQVINRVGWDGMIRPPYPEELGWKETVKMSPLEDIIVALQPKSQMLPFVVPNSMRPLDPTAPVNSNITVTNPVNGNAITVVNKLTNFAWEYVWHCHLLGHEENDMMRPVAFSAPNPVILPPARADQPGRNLLRAQYQPAEGDVDLERQFLHRDQLQPAEGNGRGFRQRDQHHGSRSCRRGPGDVCG